MTIRKFWQPRKPQKPRRIAWIQTGPAIVRTLTSDDAHARWDALQRDRMALQSQHTAGIIAADDFARYHTALVSLMRTCFLPRGAHRRAA